VCFVFVILDLGMMSPRVEKREEYFVKKCKETLTNRIEMNVDAWLFIALYTKTHV